MGLGTDDSWPCECWVLRVREEVGVQILDVGGAKRLEVPRVNVLTIMGLFGVRGMGHLESIVRMMGCCVSRSWLL